VEAILLLAAFLAFMFLGMPVAYAMGLATLVTALWIDIPLEAVMQQISNGMAQFALLTIPFFVLGGASSTWRRSSSASSAAASRW